MALHAQAFGTGTPRACLQARRGRCAGRVVCQARATDSGRRSALQGAAAFAAAAFIAGQPLVPTAQAAGLPAQEFKLLCDAECAAKLEGIEAVTTPSGLQYKDIVVGSGPNPPIGFQVVVHYVAMTPAPQLRVFDSSLDKGKPYDVRVGAGQVVKGLDEGLLSMKPGGLRRLYIPGPLSFPKGLKAAAGRASVPPGTPVVFDVQLLYIPGLEVEDE